MSNAPAYKRHLAHLAIAATAFLLALLPSLIPVAQPTLQKADEFFYDTFYLLRPQEDQARRDIVIVAVDQTSLDAVDKSMKFGWPWPRELYGSIIQYAENAGAQAVVFDLLFSETSAYQDRTGDDDNFADVIKVAKIPLVFGAMVSSDASYGRFAPPVPAPTFGAVDVGDDKIYRRYPPLVFSRPSLALAAVTAAGQKTTLPTHHPFLLHYYGPYKTSSGKTTFNYVSAATVLAAQLGGPAATEKAQRQGLTPALFKNKIVLIGVIAAGGHDIKSSPLSKEYPGVEVQATAIANLLHGQSVTPVSLLFQYLTTLLVAIATAYGVLLPRRGTLKALAPLLIAALLFALAAYLFIHPSIRWLSPVMPAAALLIATLIAFTWAYITEDKQRRFMLKALSKVVSPAIAQELAQNPEKLVLGTTRTQLTLLFTDVANFTDMSEAMDVEKLGVFMNRYLGHMSDQVLAHHGTLDKYIGDAIMCFWNAPLPQPDHALHACRAALAMKAKEREIQPELRALGAASVFTRIGINTTPTIVGFVGSDHLFNYTALGDGVNLASRLEGANKIYGSEILLAESTAALVQDYFLLRKLDILRVKGKKQPMAVYELLAEKSPADPAREKLTILAQTYETAFGYYQRQQWTEAEHTLQPLTDSATPDAPARALLKRIDHLRKNPPPLNWDGIYDAQEK